MSHDCGSVKTISKFDTTRRASQEATTTREKKARLYQLHSPKPCSTFPRCRAMVSPEGAREEAAQSDKERLGRKRRPGQAGYKELICSTMGELMLGVVASPRVPMQTCNRKYVAISAGPDASSAVIEYCENDYWNASCLLWLSLSTVGRWCYPWLKLRDHFDILARTPPKKKYFLLVCG